MWSSSRSAPSGASRSGRRTRASRRSGSALLAPELLLVPRGHRRELEQRASAERVAIGEVRLRIVPRDLQQPLLDALVEPGAAEDQLPQPVDEGLAAHERDVLPLPDEVLPEPAARLRDASVGGQLDEVARLVVVELVPCDQPELDAGRGDPLLEVGRVEAEPVAQELDLVVLPRPVVRLAHVPQDNDRVAWRP